MTQQQKRIKLAEFDGWKQEYIHGNGVDADVWIHPNGKDCRAEEWFPDYFNDNDSCRECEDKYIRSRGDEMESYYFWNVLPKISGTQWILDVGPNYRAEALGQTLNLW